MKALAFTPDGAELASGLEKIRITEASSGKTVRTIPGPRVRILAIAFSPDGRRLAVARLDGTILVTDADTSLNPRTLLQGSSVNAVAFNHDGSVLAGAGADGAVKLWDTATWKLRRARIKHKEWVWSVAFSPDGKVVASASNDRSVRLWDVETGREILTLRTPQAVIS